MQTSLPFYKPAPFMYSTVAQRGWNDPTDIMRWTPSGYRSSAYDIPNNQIRTYSPYGVRGSTKYPFGKVFKEVWEIDGYNSNFDILLLAIVIVLLLRS